MNINRLQILNGNNINSDENIRDENMSNEQRLRIALYKKFGFVQTGLTRDFRRLDGITYNAISMEVLL